MGARRKKSDDDVYTYIDFRTNLSRLLVMHAANNYILKHDEVLTGSLPSLIEKDSPAGIILKLLKEFCQTKVYCHISVQKIELAGHKAITGLLEQFKPLLEADEDRFKRSLNYENKKDNQGRNIVIEKKLLTLFPARYKETYYDEVKKIKPTDDRTMEEWAIRAHLVTDFISGMTDDFAMKTYLSLNGIKI